MYVFLNFCENCYSLCIDTCITLLTNLFDIFYLKIICVNTENANKILINKIKIAVDGPLMPITISIIIIICNY